MAGGADSTRAIIDFAALMGRVFALVAVLLTIATGTPTWDASGTLTIGVLLICNWATM